MTFSLYSSGCESQTAGIDLCVYKFLRCTSMFNLPSSLMHTEQSKKRELVIFSVLSCEFNVSVNEVDVLTEGFYFLNLDIVPGVIDISE